MLAENGRTTLTKCRVQPSFTKFAMTEAQAGGGENDGAVEQSPTANNRKHIERITALLRLHSKNNELNYIYFA